MSLRFIAESRKITAIMCGGDVIVVSINEEGAPVGASKMLIPHIQFAFSTTWKAHLTLEFLPQLGILMNQSWQSSLVQTFYPVYDSN